MWVLTAGTLAVMLSQGVRYSDQYSSLRYILQALYVAALLWHIGRTGPPLNRLPEIRPQLLPRRELGRWIPVLGIALLLVLTTISDDGVGITLLLLIISTLWLLVFWRREIRLRAVVQGLGLGLLAYLGGLPAMTNGLIGEFTFYALLALVPPMYVAGGLLCTRTKLGGIQLFEEGYSKALRSLLWGCLLFVPLGLINAAEGSPGSGITWVTEWWMPFSLPWFSGIAEETWFRLMLLGLCYFLLRPALREQPTLAVIAAVLFSGIVFGLGHGRTLERFLTTGLLYGVPMAVLFARRDFEHAVGAHYMVNMIPWAAVFLES